MSTLTTQNLIDLFHAQVIGSQLWIREWERHKDISSVRNAALAIGKVHGVYNALVYSIAGNEDLNQNVVDIMHEYNRIWSNLTLS
jgi:hypothetical protein